MVGDERLEQRRRDTLARVRDALAAGRPLKDVTDQLVRDLYRGYDPYSWVGIYMVEGEMLRLWSWDGPAPTEHVEIPLHTGLCGLAASTGETANVPDVSKDERYLECFGETRSELVVPILHHGRVYGEIDIDSDELAAFDDADEAFLSRLCDLLGEKAAAERLQGRVATG